MTIPLLGLNLPQALSLQKHTKKKHSLTTVDKIIHERLKTCGYSDQQTQFRYKFQKTKTSVHAYFNHRT